jgi:hypothetical protein
MARATGWASEVSTWMARCHGDYPRPVEGYGSAPMLRTPARHDRFTPVLRYPSRKGSHTRGGTAYGSAVEVEGPSGVGLVGARPSEALKLAAVLPAPIVVTPDVLAEAQGRLEGHSSEAILLRRAVAAEQMTIHGPSADR